jgi:hypothetical protein
MKFTQQFRQRFPNVMATKFEQYTAMIHPFPIDPDKLYWSCWNEEEKNAMHLLKDRGIIPKGNSITIKLQSLYGRRDFLSDHVTFKMRMTDTYNGYRWPDASIKDGQILDQQLYADLLGWSVMAARHTAMRDALRHYVSTTMSFNGGVNTPGQLFRVWPEIACMMPSKYSYRVMGQKLRSSLPSHWGDEELEGFRSQAYFDELGTAFMAISLMDLVDRETQYPTVA